MLKPADYPNLLQQAVSDAFPDLAPTINQIAQQRLVIHPHGDMPRWQQALTRLPDVAAQLDATTDQLTLTTDAPVDSQQVREALMGLHPWRKGPFNIFGVHVDCEWRSDWKWQRLAPHIASLKGRRVLDVGCGSGYHCWRMLGAGADWILGIDPSILFYLQFLVIKQYLPQLPVWYAPIRMQDIPAQSAAFDSVFSMGVLYHRRDPLQHLANLKNVLRQNGQLVLETLVVDGDVQTVLMPQGRYAAMRNVWFIPSVDMLKRWLERMGFNNVRCVDVSPTRIDEQRATEWMRFQSLADFLDSDNNKTREGYDAPKRAVLLAEKA